MELLLGAGASREKKLWLGDKKEWTDLLTVDFNGEHGADFVRDLRVHAEWQDFLPDFYDEVHAYDVMEHLGQQGDFEVFFQQWSEIWRILRPEGHFFGISPAPTSPWAWGDPGHTRIISPQCLYFLSQPNYEEVGRSPMTDYRFCYKADFEMIHSHIDPQTLQYTYVLKAVKPARIK